MLLQYIFAAIYIVVLIFIGFIVFCCSYRFISWCLYRVEKAYREEFELEKIRRHASVIRDINEFRQIIEIRDTNRLQQMESDILHLMNREILVSIIQKAPCTTDWKKEGF